MEHKSHAHLKSTLLCSLVLAFVLTFGWTTTPALASSTLCVDPTNTPTCYTTIQAAIEAAASGDTISVAAGTYTEVLNLVKDGITIQGAGVGATIIDASASGSYGWNVQASNISLQGFTFIGPSSNAAGRYGIKVAGVSPTRASGFSIQNVTIQDSGRTGLDINGVDGVIIDHITVTNANASNSANGVALSDVNNATLTNVTTSGNNWGGVAIYTYGRYFAGGSDHVTITSLSASESNPLYVQLDKYGDSAHPYPLTNFTASQFDYAGQNKFDTASLNFTFYNDDLNELAGYITTLAHPETSFIKKLSDGSFRVLGSLHIQAAIDAAGAGDTVKVYPGSYSETAANRTVLGGTAVQQGPHQFGLFFPINKPGLNLIGVDGSGNAITDPHSANLPYITTNATNNFGYSGIWVEGNNVTVQGFNIGPNTAGNNKTFEIVASGFTLKYSNLSVPNGSVYFGDWRYNAGTATSAIESYTIDHNVFDDGTQVSINNGTGYSGPVSGRVITNNEFTFSGATSPAISFNGSGTDVPWFVYPSGGAVISGNSFSGSTQYIRSRGTVRDADFDWASYWNNNTFDKKVMAGVNPPAQPRAYTSMSGSYSMPNTRHIGSVIQDEIGNAQSGDIVRVGAGTYTERLSINKTLTLQGEDENATIVQSPNTIPTCFATRKAVLCIDGVTATIKNLTVDGAGRGNSNYQFTGIAFHNAAGTVDHVKITAVRETPLNGNQHGVGLFAYNEDSSARTLNVTSNTVLDYQKNGMAFSGTGLTANVSNNTVTGAGPLAIIAQNGIQISYDATGTISGNAVNGNFWTGTYGGSNNPASDANADGAAGILLYQTGGTVEVAGNTLTGNQFGAWGVAAAGLNIHDNTITGAVHNGSGYPTGIAVWDSDQWSAVQVATNATITSNSISTGDYALLVRDRTPGGAVPAAVAHLNSFTGSTIFGAWSNVTLGGDKNWWGAANGPAGSGLGSGSPVSANIDFMPWCANATCTQFRPATVTTLTDKPDASGLGRSAAIKISVTSIDGTPTGTVDVKEGSTVLCSAVALTNGSGACNITFITLGIHVLKAVYPGDTNFIASTSADESHNVVDKAAIDVFIAGINQGSYLIPLNQGTRQSYTNINNGPVKLVSTSGLPVVAAERVIYTVDSTATSFSEMMGLPKEQLTDTYWFPWYNNADLDTQLRFANAGSSSTDVTITVGSTDYGPYTLTAGASTRISLPGVNNGPVKVHSAGGVPIVAAERVIYNVGSTATSFSETMGLPKEQLSDTYWFPWYNNADLDTQLRFGNAGSSSTDVTITVGSTDYGPYTLATGTSIRVSLPGVNNGPVKVHSTGGVPIVAADRVIYNVGSTATSFSEMMGLPKEQLSDTYWFPWHNNVDLDTQLRFANAGSSSTDVTITVGSTDYGPYTLAAGTSTRISLPGINNGPIKVHSTGGVPIVAAERVIYNIESIAASFSEMMGLPKEQLSDTYWFPWYNNVDLDTQLRFGVP